MWMSHSRARRHPEAVTVLPGHREESLRILSPLLPCPGHTLRLLICSSSPPCRLLGRWQPLGPPRLTVLSQAVEICVWTPSEPVISCLESFRATPLPWCRVQGSHPGSVPSGVSCTAPLPHVLSLTLLGTHLPARSMQSLVGRTCRQLPVECQHFPTHLKTRV